MIKRLVMIVAVLTAALVACGIPNNGQVATIQDKDLRQLGDTIPPTSTSTTPPTTLEPTTTTLNINTTTTIAIDEVTVYLISGGQLAGYPRLVAKPATISVVLAKLQEGPPAGDVGRGIRSAVPTAQEATISANDGQGSGVATVELPVGFFEQIPQEDQLLAIGQIVLTVTEIGGIGQVLFTQNGSPLAVPRRSGGLTDGTEPLARRDYEELLNSPLPTTTTTSTTPPLETTVV
ncbi:MAG: GerMN domain-containing protein [Ilumatobacteraceae bacterium]